MARWTPINLAGGAYSDDTKPWSCQDTVNYIPVPAERQGTRSPSILRSAHGFTTFSATMQEAPVRGLHNVEGLLLAVTGDALYRIGVNGLATEIGKIPGVSRVSMAHNQVTYGHEVVIANGQSGYLYNTYTGDFGQISDDGFPGLKVAAFVDGYIAGVEPQGRFWAHSDLRDAGSWNTLDRYDSESSPDKMVSLIVSHREVMVLNKQSSAFFRNVGAATGTFQNSNGTEMEVGCASTFAVAVLDNTVFWLGHDGIVYRLAGHAPQRISTGPIEQAISRCNMANAFAFTFEDRGHKIFYLTFPDGATWGYDVWTNEWHRRQSKDLPRWRLSDLVQWNGAWIGGDFSNGLLYQLDWAVQTEAGEEMEKRRITPVLHDNQNRITINAVELVVDTGVLMPARPLLPELSISGDLPDGFKGEQGTYQYQIVGGVLPYADVLVTAGSLPPGATIDGEGLVTFEYTTAGSYSWTIQVTDAAGNVATLNDSAVIEFALAAALVSWWPLTEPNGTRFDATGTNDLDVVTQDTIGEPSGVVTGVPGSGSGVALTNDRCFSRAAAECEGLDDAEEYEIACWIKTDDYAQGAGAAWQAASKSGFGGTGYVINTFSGSGTPTTIGTAQTNTWPGNVKNTGLPLNEWVLVFASRAGGSRNIAFNLGADVVTQSAATVTNNSGHPFRLGEIPGYATVPGDGAFIGQTAFFNRKLTEAEREWLYNDGAGRTYDELQIEAGLE